MSIKKIILITAILTFTPFFVSAGDTLGQTTQFFIDTKYDESGRSSVLATLRHISDRGYFYVEETFYNRISDTARSNLPTWISNLANEFDNKIYPPLVNFWGQEYNPGVDGDSRISILLAPLVDTAGGYFDSGNENQKSQDPQSNQREMIYLNANIISNTFRMSSFLAHEFQHLISFNQKEILRGVSDDIWFNELRSEYSPTITGYNDNFVNSNLERRVKAFLDFPSDSLTEWKNLPADYGSVAIFAEYLAEHFGVSVLADSLRSEKISIESINEALLKNNYQTDFEAIFRNWSIANILNDITLKSDYGYFKDGLRRNIFVQPTKIFSNLSDISSYIYSGQIKDWQPQWFLVSGFSSGTRPVLEFSFSGEDVSAEKVIFISFANDGRKMIQLADLSKESKIYVDNLPDFDKIIFIPYRGKKLTDFTANEPSYAFSFVIQRLDQLPQTLSTSDLTPTPTPTLTPVPTPSVSPVLPAPLPLSKPSFPEGSLLRAKGDIKVYIITNGWKRHISSSKIFDFYGHLGFDKVIEVDPSVINSYPESKLIRYVNEQKVYELDGSYAKHWLNVSADAFTASGRKWDSIFVINERELNFYKTGVNIIK